MFQLPDQLKTRCRDHFVDNGIKGELLDEYLKWLRFFLDFCEKYKIEGLDTDRLRRFIQKLKEKISLKINVVGPIMRCRSISRYWRLIILPKSRLK